MLVDGVEFSVFADLLSNGSTDSCKTWNTSLALLKPSLNNPSDLGSS